MGWRLSGIVLLVLATVQVGCNSPSRNSSITQDDLDVTVNKMAASLAASDFLAERTDDAPQIVLVTNKVSNLTDNLMSLTERWMLVARVQSTLPIRTMADQKNIAFVLPPERYEDLRNNGYDHEMPSGLEPTHVMTATFISNRRGAAKGSGKITSIRTNYYYLEYSITAINSREILWSDAFEFVRVSHGNIID